jgi:hypothetical protein
MKNYYANHKENKRKMWNRLRKKKYGPNAIRHYAEQKKKQRNRCAICGKKPNKKNTVWGVLNQDHKGKLNRGLLCSQCNRAIGLFYENIKSLENAIAYLRSWS